MESKRNIAVLGFLCLFVIAQVLSLELEKFAKYETCWNYANCLSDGNAPQKIVDCIKILRPEELQSVYQVIQDHFNFKSNNPYDAIKEYCKIDDAKKPDVFHKALNGIIAYKKKVCADGSKKGACTRIRKYTECAVQELDQLYQEGKCQLDA